jgi:exodeoxyribonuclease VII small subunit
VCASACTKERSPRGWKRRRKADVPHERDDGPKGVPAGGFRGEGTGSHPDPVLEEGPVADSAAPAVSEKYEDLVQRLSKVVERLEGGGLSLEESIAAFEEGIRLARAGAAKLEEAERKVEILLEGDRLAPFSGQDK